MDERRPMESGNDAFDPYNMDKEEFNVDLCMLRYCNSCNLPQIIARRNNLDSEINGLNGAIQNILYDNYSKVIGTTKVISNIKNNFADMSNDMELLQERMIRLGSTTDSILKNLQPRKDAMAKLLKTKKNMSKIIDLIELIPKLKKLVEEDEHVKAAECFLEAEEQLKIYGHLPPCKGIKRESRDILVVIQKKLEEKTDCSVYSSKEVTKIVELLLKLGEKGELVLKGFLAQTKCTFLNILVTVDSVFEHIPLASKNQAVVAEARGSRLCNLGLRYIDILYRASATVRSVFLKRNSLMITLDVLPILVDFMTESIGELFQKLKVKFSDLFNEVSDEFIANILDRLYRRWYDCCLLIPSAEISQLSSHVFLDFCQELCNFYYRRMESDFLACVAELREKALDVTTLDKTLKWIRTTIESIFTSTLSSLSVFLSPEHKCSRNIHFRKTFCKVYVREGVIISFFHFLIQRECTMHTDVVSSKQDRINLRVYLLLSVYMTELSQNIIKKLLNSIDENFHSSDLIVTPIDEITTRCDLTSNEMLREFCQVWVRTMSVMFDKSVENKNWFDMKEPRKVSSVVRRIADEFDAVSQDTEFLPMKVDEPTRRSSGLAPCPSSISRASSQSIDSNDTRVIHRISTMFSQSPKYFEKIEFCRDSVLSRILELTLKSISERVRLKTFNRHGLQQMQVDLHYLEKRVVRHIRDEKHFISVFDDILSSCSYRTVQPEFLSVQVVSALSDTY